MSWCDFSFNYSCGIVTSITLKEKSGAETAPGWSRFLSTGPPPFRYPFSTNLIIQEKKTAPPSKVAPFSKTAPGRSHFGSTFFSEVMSLSNVQDWEIWKKLLSYKKIMKIFARWEDHSFNWWKIIIFLDGYWNNISWSVMIYYVKSIEKWLLTSQYMAICFNTSYRHIPWHMIPIWKHLKKYLVIGRWCSHHTDKRSSLVGCIHFCSCHSYYLQT